MGHRLIVELLVQQRVLLLKSNYFEPEPELGTVGRLDHFHKTVLEELRSDAVSRMVRTSQSSTSTQGS